MQIAAVILLGVPSERRWSEPACLLAEVGTPLLDVVDLRQR